MIADTTYWEYYAALRRLQADIALPGDNEIIEKYSKRVASYVEGLQKDFKEAQKAAVKDDGKQAC